MLATIYYLFSFVAIVLSINDKQIIHLTMQLNKTNISDYKRYLCKPQYEAKSQLTAAVVMLTSRFTSQFHKILSET